MCFKGTKFSVYNVKIDTVVRETEHMNSEVMSTLSIGDYVTTKRELKLNGFIYAELSTGGWFMIENIKQNMIDYINRSVANIKL